MKNSRPVHLNVAVALVTLAMAENAVTVIVQREAIPMAMIEMEVAVGMVEETITTTNLHLTALL